MRRRFVRICTTRGSGCTTRQAEELDTLVLGIVHVPGGEAIAATVHAHPQQEDLRLEQLVRVLAGQPLFDSESVEPRHH